MSFRKNKPNFPYFSPKNYGKAKKQTQFKAKYTQYAIRYTQYEHISTVGFVSVKILQL